MPRGATLAELVTMTKAEMMLDSDSAVSPGGDATLKVQIANQQKWLAQNYNFSDLQIRREIALVAGTQYYAFPVTATVSDFDLTSPLVVECYWGEVWYPVEPGITIEDYNLLNPATGQRMDPVKKWQKHRAAGEDPKIEVWPLPASAGTLRLTGQMTLPALAADGDKAELDDLLIAQWTAAKLLARMKSADAQAMLAEARLTLQRLIGGDNSPSATFSMAGPSRHAPQERVTVAVNYTP